MCDGCFVLWCAITLSGVLWFCLVGAPKLIEWDLERYRRGKLVEAVREAMGLPEDTDSFDVRYAFLKYMEIQKAKHPAPITRPAESE